MDVFLSLIVLILASRFILSVGLAILVSLLLSHLWPGLTPAIPLTIVAIGTGFGLIWQGRKLSGVPLFAAVATPDIGKPVAFLGLAFLGLIVGAFCGKVLGSLVTGGLCLVALVVLVAGWYAIVLKRHVPLAYLAFVCISLLSGLGALQVLILLRS
jgi:hypothetical protein